MAASKLPEDWRSQEDPVPMAPGGISSKPDSSPFEGPDGEKVQVQLLYITREEHDGEGQ